MAKVIVGIGIPGSGKTTVLKQIAERYGYAYVCPDDIRLELTGSATDQTRNGDVWQEAYRRLAEQVGAGTTVVFDATLADPQTRERFLAAAHAAGAAKVQAVYVDVPLETAKERNAARERVVPEHVLERMHASLESQAPSVTEGFDAVFTLDAFTELAEVEKQGEQGILRR